jgi:hypothetical protein
VNSKLAMALKLGFPNLGKINSIYAVESILTKGFRHHPDGRAIEFHCNKFSETSGKLNSIKSGKKLNSLAKMRVRRGKARVSAVGEALVLCKDEYFTPNGSPR